MDQEEVTAVCIDNGSGTIKAGFAGDEAPRVIFPSLIGQPKFVTAEKEFYFGKDISQRQGSLIVNQPINQGIVTNWEDMEKIWHHALFTQLRVQPEEHPIIMTEASLNPKQNREAMTKIMFEQFNVPCLYVSSQEVCALYASGRTTGLILDSGDGITHAVPIYEGFQVPYATLKMQISGRDLTAYLSQILKEKGLNCTTPAEMEIIRDIKETMCFVASDFEDATKEASKSSCYDKTYDLPDGRKLTLGAERFRCPEALFEPMQAGIELEGIQKYCFDAVQRCDPEYRREMLGHLILSGGNTLFEGMAERLQQEVHQIAPSSIRVRVFSPPERLYSAWLGASTLASLGTFQTMWITKQEYDESGPNIIHRKCF